MTFQVLLEKIDSLVWGPPLLLLLVGTGVYLTIRLGLLQVFRLPLALKLVFRPSKTPSDVGDVSSFAALCTALSATIGTGNIVGVATAIKLGGPGALFWMWMAAFFGMATKYAECLLAVKYREVDARGFMAGGPMYYISKGLGLPWLGKLFAIFGVTVALLGIGTFPQVNAIAEASEMTFGLPVLATCIILGVLVALVTIGGIQSISRVAQTVVPFMVVFYVAASLLLLGLHIEALPAAVSLVISSAFTGHAAAGGFVGATFMLAIQMGVARGVFSNESGLGSAPIAAAAARTNSCAEQGLISMTGTFFDTIIVCSMTGLVLIVTGAWTGDTAGAVMTNTAFQQGLSAEYGQYIVTIGLIFFAFTTILGWNYYGERCVQYLAGVKAIAPYRVVFVVCVVSSAFLHLNMIWTIADILNGLMAIPNLIGLIGLRHVIATETRLYFSQLAARKTATANP